MSCRGNCSDIRCTLSACIIVESREIFTFCGGPYRLDALSLERAKSDTDESDSDHFSNPFGGQGIITRTIMQNLDYIIALRQVICA